MDLYIEQGNLEVLGIFFYLSFQAKGLTMFFSEQDSKLKYQ